MVNARIQVETESRNGVVCVVPVPCSLLVQAREKMQRHTQTRWRTALPQTTRTDTERFAGALRMPALSLVDRVARRRTEHAACLQASKHQNGLSSLRHFHTPVPVPVPVPVHGTRLQGLDADFNSASWPAMRCSERLPSWRASAHSRLRARGLLASCPSPPLSTSLRLLLRWRG